MNCHNLLPIEIIDDDDDPDDLPHQTVKKPRLDTNEEAIFSPDTMGSESYGQNQLVSDQPEERYCRERVIRYLYHLRLQPSDNNITYWRIFVENYFAPGAKKRWCMSLYDKAVRYRTVNPKDVWPCEVCGCRAGRGFEVGFDSLPRLTKLAYDHGLTEELYFIDVPKSNMLPSGQRLLKYHKAVQESVYEDFRVVREGELRISFTLDLKIMSWEFCVRSHQILLTQSLVTSLIDEARQRGKKDVDKYIYTGVLGRRSRTKKESLVDVHGFSMGYARCLKVNEILESMKDIMNFSVENHIGPIESSRLCYPELQNRERQEKHTTPTSHFAYKTTNNDSSNMVSNSMVRNIDQNNYNNNYNTMNQAYQVPTNRSSRTSTDFAGNVPLGSQGHYYRESQSVEKVLQEMRRVPRFSMYRTVPNNEASQGQFTRMLSGSENLMQDESSYTWAGTSPRSSTTDF